MRISGEERRRQILEAVQRLCAENGFAGTTLDDVAEEVGVSRSLVLQHFGSKEGIYDALVGFVAGVHALEEDRVVPQKIRDKDDRGVFHAFASHVFEHNLRQGKQSILRLFMFSLLENPELFGKSTERRDKAWEPLVSYIENRQAEGVFRPVDARHVVQAFRSLVDQLAMQAICANQREKADQFYPMVETVIDIVLAGIKAEA